MGLDEFNALSKSYGLATALLIVACLSLLYAVRTLYRENRILHDRLEQLCDERVKALESVLADEARSKGAPDPH